MRETETKTESFWVRSGIILKKERKGGFSSMRLGQSHLNGMTFLFLSFFFGGGVKRQTLVW
jgi:hypothetical protein